MMSSFSSRPLQIWRSSLAESMVPIHGVFSFEVVPSVMVPQTLEFLREQNIRGIASNDSIISAFIRGMYYHGPGRENQLLYWQSFKDGPELFSTNIVALSDAVRQLEVHTDINFTFSRVAYLADIGSGPTQPLMIIERMPFARAVAFEIEERGEVMESFKSGDFQLSIRAKAAQRHYSTGLSLLAGEDQIAGLLDAAFMQFYLAVECILDAHETAEAIKNGVKAFGPQFSTDLQRIVRHVYLARHRFFGHGHPNFQQASLDSEIAFAIAKQTLVVRWCSRALISLDLGRKLVLREVRLYPDPGRSIEFNGSVASLETDFALPT